MKKIIYILLAVLLCTVMLNSCDELNVKPKSSLNQTDVWNDPSLIKAFLTNIYRGLGTGLAQGKLSEMTDDATSVPADLTEPVTNGTISPNDRAVFDDSRGDLLQYNWTHIYKYIHQANIFLNKIDNAPINDPKIKKDLKGQALFLRAYFYSNLLFIYGGIPIITKVYKLNDNFLVPRNSFAECVNFIVQEADSAANLLPLKPKNKGRASKGAALALKSRVLLFAASDLYNINPSGMPETGYVKNMNRKKMWQDAKKAAKAVMELGIYSLYKPNPAPGDSVAQNYYEIYRTYDNSQAILQRYWPKGKGADFLTSRKIGANQYHGPNGYHQWGGNTPTEQLVDAYEMKDGSDFSWNNTHEVAHPYQNRDPRFYATILYDGASWLKRPSDVIQYDKDNVIQTFTEFEYPNGHTVPGVDTRQSPIDSWNATHSGYYMRKFMSESVPHNVAQKSVWMYFNYAGILLNYAEASIHLGEYADARGVMNKIRRRVNMPTYGSALNGQALMEEYRQERRIELAFEGLHYFDIRRWMTAPKVMDEDAKGISIHVKGTDRADRSTYHDYTYKVITYQKRHWDDKMYFMPISKDELNRDKKLIQNPGW